MMEFTAVKNFVLEGPGGAVHCTCHGKDADDAAQEIAALLTAHRKHLYWLEQTSMVSPEHIQSIEERV